LWWVVAAPTAILAGVLLFPPARELFHFGPLHGDDVGIALASGLAALLRNRPGRRIAARALATLNHQDYKIVIFKITIV
jgi:hypothetical protein